MIMERSSTGAQSRVRTVFYTVATLVSLTGLAEATYLTVLALTGATDVCGGSADCFRVLGSSYAKIVGIPVALFGALAYFGTFSCATFAAFGHALAGRFFSIIVWTMFAFTLWLLFVQAFLLHAFCHYCLFSAAMIFLLAAIAVSIPSSDRGPEMS
jgi:uncharacterized membrane protein